MRGTGVWGPCFRSVRFGPGRAGPGQAAGQFQGRRGQTRPSHRGTSLRLPQPPFPPSELNTNTRSVGWL